MDTSFNYINILCFNYIYDEVYHCTYDRQSNKYLIFSL